MKKHLSRKYKCKRPLNDIKNEKTDIELDCESLVRRIIKDEIINLMTIEKKNIIEMKIQRNKCKCCNKIFHNKSNLNKHFISGICFKKINNNNNNNNNICIQSNNNIKINNQQNNNYHINNMNIQSSNNNSNIIIINQIKGFDEDWNLSNISKDNREKLLLSDKKFTNTLNNILQNKDNLNVVIKNEDTGFVYINEKKDYEAMQIKNICEEAMDKLYKHLRDFFKETISNNINDIKINILEKEMIEIDKKYTTYKESLKTKRNVNSCISNIFQEKTEEALDNLITLQEINDKKYINLLNNDIDNDY
jgi:hypothetical protein